MRTTTDPDVMLEVHEAMQPGTDHAAYIRDMIAATTAPQWQGAMFCLDCATWHAPGDTCAFILSPRPTRRLITPDDAEWCTGCQLDHSPQECPYHPSRRDTREWTAQELATIPADDLYDGSW